jgi:hypothetical protein
MAFSWDRSDARIWYGTWTDDRDARKRLRLIVERLPHANGWDWSVWQPDDTRIVRRGIEKTAAEAVIAAEAMALILGADAS